MNILIQKDILSTHEGRLLNASITNSADFIPFFIEHPSHIEWVNSSIVNLKRFSIYTCKVFLKCFRSLFFPGNTQFVNPFLFWLFFFQAFNIYRRFSNCNSSYVHSGHNITNVVIDSKLRFTRLPLYSRTLYDIYYIASYLQVYSIVRDRIISFKPKSAIALYTCYCQHLGFINACMDRSIPIYFAFRGNLFLSPLKTSYPVHLTDYSALREFRKNSSADALLYFQELSNKALSARKKGINIGQTYMKKTAFSNTPTSDQLSESISSSIVVFLHDFYDSPHIYPGLDFNDFLDWSINTIKFLISMNKKIFVKPHPNQIYPSICVSNLLVSIFPQVNLLDPTFSNDSIFKARPHLIVTAYGNVSLEAAYYGIKSISAIPYAPSFSSEHSLVSLDRSTFYINIKQLLTSDSHDSTSCQDTIALGMSLLATYLDDNVDVSTFLTLSESLIVSKREESLTPINYRTYPLSPERSYIFSLINNLLARIL